MNEAKLYLNSSKVLNISRDSIKELKYNFVKDCLINRKIGVIKEGALYRLVGCALDFNTVNVISKIDSLKLNKIITIFISDIRQVRDFGVEITSEIILGIKTYWPGEYSIILPTKNKNYLKYISYDYNGICFHMPDCFEVLHLIDEVGPIVTRLANIKEIEDLKSDIRINLDFYYEIESEKKDKNKIIKFVDGSVIKLINS